MFSCSYVCGLSDVQQTKEDSSPDTALCAKGLRSVLFLIKVEITQKKKINLRLKQCLCKFFGHSAANKWPLLSNAVLKNMELVY